ncbi:hypothetical protein N7605_18325 [Pantoea ananatis]|uniref:hypothetical protein n=1 Tax=Pantoea ananas TaxID=553 RepID=UPI00287C68D7|nr:hypothetical protein [Pantoea ananatis]MDS7721761.1 hypothetical protein [Pantoea ananatis]
MSGNKGRAGWQWLFDLEAEQNVFVGFLVIAVYRDSVEAACSTKGREKRQTMNHTEKG